MYHDYASQAYYIKARSTQLINEAAQARQAREFHKNTEPKTVLKKEKAFRASFGTLPCPNMLVRHDI